MSHNDSNCEPHITGYELGVSMHIWNEAYLKRFLRLLPLEVWYIIMEYTEDWYWSDASLAIAMGLNFHDLRRLQWVVKKI